MRIEYKHSALAVMATALAAAIRPPELIAPSAWAEANLVVVDGPRAGQKFDLSLTPYLREPLDFFADDCPDNKASIRKSKQCGGTEVAIAAIGYSIAAEPCDLFLIEPTAENLNEFTQLKLQPTIEATPALAERVKQKISRSSKGSTARIKRFAGGTLLTGIASSTADLRGKTRKKVVRDEVSEYDDDLDGQGSPHDMIAGSYETFLATGDWKNLGISTPRVKGACQIDAEFNEGDQRFWHVRCPGCEQEFHFKWDAKLFRFKRAYPYEAYYVCPHEACGTIISSLERNALVRAGRWIATASAPGKPRSYHIDAFISPFVPWDVIAERIVKAGDNPSTLKTLYNFTFGLPYEVKSSAPDWKQLLDRAQQHPELKRYHVPPQGLLLTAFVDVQLRGLWVEVVAHAPSRESWVVDATYIEGDTSHPGKPVFDQLRREILDRDYPDAFGRTRRLDAVGIDSGYRAHVVYAFVRMRQRLHPDTGRDVLLATKGLKGWGRPALGMPQLVDIDLDGKKIKDGAKVWGIGTWSLKGSICSDLFLEMAPLQEGEPPPQTPDGYCHFGNWVTDEYFKQLASETLVNVERKGRITGREWVAHAPNHYFDCRVGNVALAEYLGLSTTTAEEWAALARIRGLPPELSAVDLFTPRDERSPEGAPVPAEAAETSDDGERARRDNWISPQRGWLRRH